MVEIPFFKSSINKEKALSLLEEAIKNHWLTSGPLVTRFEEKLSSFVKQNLITTSSCTHSLHLSLKLSNLRKNDEVIIPSNTFISTFEVIEYFQAKPVLCDINPLSWNLDLIELEKKITKNTKVIIAVLFAGMPLDMKKLNEICKKYNITLILDNAHSLEARYCGKPVNQYADYSCYSFYATKNLTTGEGGALAFKDASIIDRARNLTLHGLSKKSWQRYEKGGHWFYDVIETGYKYNMSDLQAAIGLSQVNDISKNWLKRKALVDLYYEKLKDIPQITLQRKEYQDSESAYHLFVILAENKEQLEYTFKKNKIGYSVHFIPLYRFTSVYKKYGFDKSFFPINESYFCKALTLPLYPELREEEILYICEVIHRFYYN